MTRFLSDRRLFALVLLGLGTACYGSLLTKEYDLNIVPWVVSVATPRLEDASFFFPQHLLHLPLEVIVYRAFLFVGYDQGPIVPMQLTSAFLGGVSAALFFLLLTEWIEDRVICLTVALVWLFSYQSWTMHTDAWYYPLGTAFVLLAGWLLVRIGGHRRKIREDLIESSSGGMSMSWVVAACAFALAVLFSQITLVYLPGLLLVILLDDSLRVTRSRLAAAALWTAAAGTIILAFYLLVSVGFLGHRSLAEGWVWVVGTHVKLPRWGVFSIARFIAAIPNTAAAIVPLNAGIGLRSLFNGEIRLDRLPAQITVFVLLPITVWLIVAGVRAARRIWSTRAKAVVVCLTWLIPMTVFLVWLEPQALFGCLPLFAALILVGLILYESRSGLSSHAGMLAVVALLLVGNLTGAVLPRHINAPQVAKAAQVAAQMGPTDVMISPMWDWTAYLPLYDRRSRSLIILARGSMTEEDLQSWITTKVTEVNAQGGKVYISGVERLTLVDWRWLAEEGGLRFSREDFDLLPKRLAWTLEDGERIWEVVGP